MSGEMASCRAEHTDFCGWPAIRLANGIVETVIVPDIGGRIMSFDLGTHPFLWINRRLAGTLFSPEENRGDGSLAAWKNYGGSKTWPAPQGWDTEDQWHGPPDPVLDTGRYALQALEWALEAATVRVRSPADPRTGVQLTRQLTLHAGGSRATLHLEMRNVSDRPRTWSLWDVVQLDASRHDGEHETHNERAWLYIPANPASRWPRGYNVMYGRDDNPQWQPGVRPGLLGAQYQYRLGKIGVDSSAGWIAFVDEAAEFAFCQRFTYCPGETYPDGGASVECWMTGLGAVVDGLDYARDPLYHVEAEILGPLRRMAPGETQSLDIEWGAARCPGPIVAVGAAGCIHAPLKAGVRDGELHLTGVYGTFLQGSVQLAWLDAAEQPLSSEMVATSHPLHVLKSDLQRPVPPGASAVALQVTDARGRPAGTLDRVTL
jgi:hypothetical protein